MGTYQLPETAAECRDLQEWMELCLGLTQAQVASCAGLHQSRVSAVFRGHLPRRKHWPPLLKALRLERQEHEFYRMVMAARRARRDLDGKLKALMAPETLLLASTPGREQGQADRAAG